MQQFLRGTVVFLMALAWPVHAQDNLPYMTYNSFDQLLEGRNARYVTLTRVSDPGTREHPAYTGFFFYQVLQFDTTGRYLVAMKVYFQNRDVEPTDHGDIGYIDLKDGNKWTKIGETTAWNWQQGCRAQWRPQSDEIIWNDRADDGKSFVCRTYNFRTGARRTLPRAIYDISPNGGTALTHDFERMKLFHGTEYVGIEYPYEKEFAPSETGVWKMNMETGKSEMVISLAKMAQIAYPKGLPKSGYLYFFRDGWNPSGTRFVAFIKDPANRLFQAYSMASDGTDVRYLYYNPSHHSWQDDNYILDYGRHTPPGGGSPHGGYFLFKDDGTGKAKELLWASGYDGHDSYIPGPGGDWILSDTYTIAGYQYLFLYHRPTKLFVPLAKLKSTADEAVLDGACRVDLHPRISRDGRTVCIDATHEGIGRQMYIIPIDHILDHPPGDRPLTDRATVSTAETGSSSLPAGGEGVLRPKIDGPWWTVAHSPDLGAISSPDQEPVDFAVWQAADGSWQLCSCIRNTNCGGRTRLLYRWEGRHLTDRDWWPMGIAMQADTNYGEMAGGLQAPHVVKIGEKYIMAYGDSEHICLAESTDGKRFERVLQPNGRTGLFAEGVGNRTRDPMLIRIADRWHCYYTAYPNHEGWDFCRTSADLRHWSDSVKVAFGGQAGTGPSSAECPFVVSMGRRYYLFRTQRYGENALTTVYHSNDPLDFGVNNDGEHLVGTLPVAAPEIVLHEAQYYLAALRPDLKGIQIAKLTWVAGEERLASNGTN